MRWMRLWFELLIECKTMRLSVLGNRSRLFSTTRKSVAKKRNAQELITDYRFRHLLFAICL